MSTSQDDASDRLPRVWRRREPLGYAPGLVSFASVAAPLLTGFALTAIIELTGRDDRGTRGDIAITAFALAAGLLIYAIQAGLAIGQLTVPPDQRAAQVPEARGHPSWMRRLREDQWRDATLAEGLFTRTRLAYNLGIIAFLAGLVAALLPGPGDWNPIRIVAVTAAGTAGIIELVLASGQPRLLSHWLLPTLETASDRNLTASNDKPDEMSDMTAQQLVYGGSVETTADQAAATGREITTALSALTRQLASVTRQLARVEAVMNTATTQFPNDGDDD